MKVYDLSCHREHRFEGWFSSEEDFHRQLQQLQIACPICASTSVRKLLSAPHLNLSAKPDQPFSQLDQQKQALSALTQITKKLLAVTEDVGEQFAEEARRIHYNESIERPIRGVATQEECAALLDEGIQVVPLPLSEIEKTTLQ